MTIHQSKDTHTRVHHLINPLLRAYSASTRDQTAEEGLS